MNSLIARGCSVVPLSSNGAMNCLNSLAFVFFCFLSGRRLYPGASYSHMSAGPKKPFVPWDTPDYAASHNGQMRDLCTIQRLAEEEAARYLIQRKTEDEADDECGSAPAAGYDQGGAPKPDQAPCSTAITDKMPLALMVELALQEALSIASLYERQGLRLNEKHRAILSELGKLADA